MRAAIGEGSLVFAEEEEEESEDVDVLRGSLVLPLAQKSGPAGVVKNAGIRCPPVARVMRGLGVKAIARATGLGAIGMIARFFTWPVEGPMSMLLC
jgi:hypothetical protein